MGESTIFRKFVGESVNKLVFEPSIDSNFARVDTFLSGSSGKQINKLRLWKIENDDVLGDEIHSTKSCDVPGDIADIQYISGKKAILVASSSGNVHLISEHDLRQRHTWTGYDLFNEEKYKTSHQPITSIAVNHDSPHRAVIGCENGRLLWLDIARENALEVRNCSSTPITDVQYCSSNELAITNMNGQLKLIDSRLHSQEAARVCCFSTECDELLCVAVHPTQPHVVICGTDNGSIVVWDLRANRSHANVIGTGSSEPVWQLKFHKTAPDNVFSCQNDGILLHWDVKSPFAARDHVTSQVSSHWLELDEIYKPQVRTLLPSNRLSLNSLDMDEVKLICGGSNQSIQLIKNFSVAR